jgi:carbon monoxide dehydrogenase subunit G
VSAPEYSFRTEWRVLGTMQEVFEVLEDPVELPRWWPSVYLEVEQVAPGDETGVGRRARLHTRGWLPYTLRWELTVTESRAPRGFSIEATGDLAGTGRWTLEESGAWTRIVYDWRVRAEKPLLRVLSPLLRPVLAANHRWAMRRGEESLSLELMRRRTRQASERARIPAPPGPARNTGALLLAVAVAAAFAGVAAARGLRRPRRRRLRRR